MKILEKLFQKKIGKDPRHDLGAKGEKLAEKYLKKKGYRILRRNVTFKQGEIDILMMDGDEMVIVEVRTVHDLKGASPTTKVPYSKQKQLKRVARQLASTLPDPLPTIRFDACIVEIDSGPMIYHYENAFQM
ncbi:YraN family protein [bacterium]|nr:YraN family protein [bacterium]